MKEQRAPNITSGGLSKDVWYGDYRLAPQTTLEERAGTAHANTLTAGGLISKDELWLGDQRSPNAEALALTAAEASQHQAARQDAAHLCFAVRVTLNP